MSKKKKRVLSNDDGWILGRYGPPISIEEIRNNMVGPHANSPIDTLLWSVGGREVFSFETEIGERFGWDQTSFNDEPSSVRAANLRHLIAEHGGPLHVIIELCREIGMKFFPSLRMNTHYNTDESNPSSGKFRRDHPELLIGKPGEDIPEFSQLWGLRTGKDFAHPEVRDFMINMAVELIEGFDVDGIELDFMRHPGMFRPGDAFANRYLLTDMISQIRHHMDKVGKAKGRQLELAVRVSATIADSLRLGMDTERWICDGLVDITIVGLGFNPFEAKVAEFVSVAEDTNCQILGCFEALRPVMDTEVLRAIAARYLGAGADGIYLFNFYSMDATWKEQVIGELIDQTKLNFLDKTYEIDSTRGGTSESQIHHSFRHCLAPEQLPVRLDSTISGEGVRLHFYIEDDLDTANREGILHSATLRIGGEILHNEAGLQLQLNGTTIPWSESTHPLSPWQKTVYADDWNLYPSRVEKVLVDCKEAIEIPLSSPPLIQGPNELQIFCSSKSVARSVVKYIAVTLRYHQK